MELIGYSKALFSTWFYAPEIRTLFDAGEGVNCVLTGRIAGLRHVAVSHGHTDHFTGLMNVIITRMRVTAGEPEPAPPLNVYYPARDRALGQYIDYLRNYFARFERRRKVVEWHPLRAGDTVSIGERRRVSLVAFATDHTPDVDSLGYNVVERRFKLRPEFEGLATEEVGRIVRERGREAVVEPRDHILLAFSGDTRVLKDLPCRDADVLVHESTFLTRADADTRKHAILGEVLDLAHDLNPKRLLLYHYSTRYHRRHIDGAVHAGIERAHIGFDVASVYPGVLRWEGDEGQRGLPQVAEVEDAAVATTPSSDGT
jgi:ribonuclease Z